MKLKRAASVGSTVNGIKISVLLKSLIFAYAISLLAFLVEGGIIHFTKVSEDIIPISVSIISALSILLAGIYTAKRTESRGWLNGGIVGFLYIFVIALLSYFLIPGYQIELLLLGKLALGFLVGAVGGIIGVNL